MSTAPRTVPPSARLLHPSLVMTVGPVALAVAGAVLLAKQVVVVGHFSWPATLLAVAVCNAAILIASRASHPRWLRRDPRRLSVVEGALHAGGERLLD